MGCCFLIPMMLIALAIGAVLLRAACHLAKEDVPDFGKAMGIVFVVGMIQMLLGMLINVAMGAPVIQDETQPVTQEQMAASIVGFLVNVPVTIGLYRLMIPTSGFGKAALVWLIQMLIALAIVVVIFVVVLILSFAGLL